MPNFLVHTARDRRRVVSPDSIYHLEADSDDTVIRRRGTRRIRDVRELTELTAVLAHHGFLRIHRKHAINPLHILEIRKRKNKQDWELKLAPTREQGPTHRPRLPRRPVGPLRGALIASKKGGTVLGNFLPREKRLGTCRGTRWTAGVAPVKPDTFSVGLSPAELPGGGESILRPLVGCFNVACRRARWL